MAYRNNTGLPSVTDIISPYIDKEWFTPEHSERGSAVHAACAAHLQGVWVQPLRPDWQPYYDSFRRWADIAVDKVIVIEERLVDGILGYCGQMDMIVRLKGDDADSLNDIKTSQAYYSWWRIQGAAYRNLADKNGYKTARGHSIRTKKDGSGCLVDPWPNNYAADFNIFLGLLNAHKYFKGGK